MDTLKMYSDYIKNLLKEHAAFQPIGNWQEYENQVIIDCDNKHFQLMRVGWKGDQRVHQCVLHLDLKPDGKIWIQEDWTEAGIATQLVACGVPKSDIVLAFYAPSHRETTDFAVA